MIRLLLSLLFGALIGYLGSRLMKEPDHGILFYVILGIGGSFVGGILFGLLGFASTNFIGDIISNVVGAAALIAIGRFIKK